MKTTHHTRIRRAGTLTPWALLALLAACAAPREQEPSPPAPAAATATAPPAPQPPPAERSAEVATGPAPSLADEMRAQGLREAREFERKSGVRLESVTGTVGPTWWAAAVNEPTRAAATQSAPLLPDAFNGAVSRAAAIAEARGVNPRVLKVERASWMRLASGPYIVWVSLGDGANAADPAPPVDLLSDDTPAPVKPGATAPTAPSAPPPPPTSTPPVPPPAPAAPDTDAPAWFVTSPAESAGRITVGSKAEADTDRDAQRIAFKAGRAQLAGLVGAEPADVTTVKATTIKLPGGRVRAYTLVSCSGTIKK